MGLTNFPFGISSMGVPVLGGEGGRGLVAYRKVYFVDGANGSDDNNGLSVDQPFDTIQKAANTVESRDTIIVLPRTTTGSEYDETVTTRQLDSTTKAANYVTIMGATNTQWAYDAPQIYSNTASGLCINVRAPGYRISGFRLVTPATDIACIQLNFAQGGRTADTNWSPGTQIDNCSFLGAVAAGWGINAPGSPTTIRILNNQFIGFTDSSIRLPTSEAITAQLWLVSGNYVMDCTHFIGGAGASGGLDNSIITGNILAGGKTNTLAVGIDIGDGNGNVITLNYLAGVYGSTVYPNVGGTSEWAGNITEDDGATNILEDTPWTQSDPLT